MKAARCPVCHRTGACHVTSDLTCTICHGAGYHPIEAGTCDCVGWKCGPVPGPRERWWWVRNGWHGEELVPVLVIREPRGRRVKVAAIRIVAGKRQLVHRHIALANLRPVSKPTSWPSELEP